MFRAVFVYKEKNPGHAIKKVNHAWWECFEDLDYLQNSPLWKRKCDLEKPVYTDDKVNCPLCTKQTNNFKDIINVFAKPCLAGGCDVTDRLRGWDDDEGRPLNVVAEINGRPVVFYYLSNESIDELVEETKRHVHEIKAYWAF